MISLLLLTTLHADPIPTREYLAISSRILEAKQQAKELGMCVTYELLDNTFDAFANHYNSLKENGFPDQSERDSGALAKQCEGKK